MVISCDSGVLKCYAGHERRRGTWEGKRSGEWEKANKKRRNGESTYMDGMRRSFLLIFACLTVSDIVGQCAHVSFQ